MLVEGVDASGEVVWSRGEVQVSLCSRVVRCLVPGGCNREVKSGRVVVRLIEVIERRDFKGGIRREGPDPVEDGKRVALALGIAKAVRVVVVRRLLPVIGIGVVRNLEEIIAELGIEPELIAGC